MYLPSPRLCRRHPARWPALLLACLLTAVSLAEVVHAAEPGGHGTGEACAFGCGLPGDAGVLPGASPVFDCGERGSAAAYPAPLTVAVRSGRRHGVRAPPA